MRSLASLLFESDSDREKALQGVVSAIPNDVWEKPAATVTLRYEVLEREDGDVVTPRVIIAWGARPAFKDFKEMKEPESAE